MSLDDGILRMFIDQVFEVFDSDHNGYLDVDQLHTFLNQLYIQMNEPRRFTQQQTREYMKTFDLENNGIITKPELFLLFKRLTTTEPQYPQQQSYGYQGQQGAYQGGQYSSGNNVGSYGSYGSNGSFGSGNNLPPQGYPQQPPYNPNGQYGQYSSPPQQPMYFANNPPGSNPYK